MFFSATSGGWGCSVQYLFIRARHSSLRGGHDIVIRYGKSRRGCIMDARHVWSTQSSIAIRRYYLGDGQRARNVKFSLAAALKSSCNLWFSACKRSCRIKRTRRRRRLGHKELGGGATFVTLLHFFCLQQWQCADHFKRQRGWRGS